MAITVRELPDKTGDHGTLLRPTPVGLAINGVTTLKTILGYEAIPSSDFWSFTIERPTEIRVDRVSEDIYAVHVAVAVVDRFNQRVASLVHTHDGHGQWALLQPGFYKLVVALGMPVEVRLELQVHARPFALPLAGVADLGLEAAAGVRRRVLRALAIEPAPFQAALMRPASRAIAAGDLVASGVIGGFRTMRGLAAAGDLGGMVFLHGYPSAISTSLFVAAGRIQPVLPPPAAPVAPPPGAAPRAQAVAGLDAEAVLSVETGGRLRGIAELSPLVQIRGATRMRGVAELAPIATGRLNGGPALDPQTLELMRQFRDAGTGWHRLQALSETLVTVTARRSLTTRPRGVAPPCCDQAPEPGSSTLPTEEIRPCPYPQP